MNYRQIYVKSAVYRWMILDVNNTLTEESGIYILTREENGFKYCYVGQAKHTLTRLAQHFCGFQHIDLSIKKHKLYNKDKNPFGWRIFWKKFPIEELDEREQEFIKKAHQEGYQLLNKTSGSQGKGKFSIDDKPRKGYQEGLKNGYKKALKEIAHLFELHLNAEVKKNGNKNQEKALKKFEEMIGKKG